MDCIFGFCACLKQTFCSLFTDRRMQFEAILRSDGGVISSGSLRSENRQLAQKMYYLINYAHHKSPRTQTASLLIETTDFLQFSLSPNRDNNLLSYSKNKCSNIAIYIMYILCSFGTTLCSDTDDM